MNNQELLFGLLKKIEIGEIEFSKDKEGNCWLKNKSNLQIIYLQKKDSKTGEIIKEPNKEFKEIFYQQKGLDNCWVKDCSNKIYKNEGDYKKIKIQCHDKHTRMICLEHFSKIEK